jgi:hypothetical protein
MKEKNCNYAICRGVLQYAPTPEEEYLCVTNVVFTVYCENGSFTGNDRVVALQNKNVFTITECKEQAYKKNKKVLGRLD